MMVLPPRLLSADWWWTSPPPPPPRGCQVVVEDGGVGGPARPLTSSETSWRIFPAAVVMGAEYRRQETAAAGRNHWAVATMTAAATSCCCCCCCCCCCLAVVKHPPLSPYCSGCSQPADETPCCFGCGANKCRRRRLPDLNRRCRRHTDDAAANYFRDEVRIAAANPHTR